MRQLRLGMPARFEVGQVYRHEDGQSGVGFEAVFTIADDGRPVMGPNPDDACPWGSRPRPGQPALVPSDMDLEWSYVGTLSP